MYILSWYVNVSTIAPEDHKIKYQTFKNQVVNREALNLIDE